MIIKIIFYINRLKFLRENLKDYINQIINNDNIIKINKNNENEKMNHQKLMQ